MPDINEPTEAAQELGEKLKVPNAEFDAWVASMPAKHWSKYDLSACRLGWEAALDAERQKREAAERERDYYRRMFDECLVARDASGFLGTVPQCIEHWSRSYEAAEASLAKAIQERDEAREDRNFWEDRENKALLRANAAEAEVSRLKADIGRKEAAPGRRVASAPSFADGIEAAAKYAAKLRDDSRLEPMEFSEIAKGIRALAHNPQASSEYEKCATCNGTGLRLNMAGEPDECLDCKGNTVVPAERSAAAEGNEAEAAAPMPDPAIAELVEQLREDAEYLDNYFGFVGNQYRIVRNISDLIAALTASNDRVAELERERDEAREYGKQARLRENAAEDARIHEHDLRVAAEAEVSRLKAGAVTDEMVEAAAERICRIHGVGELVWSVQADERKHLYHDVARVALEAALSNQAKASK